MMELIKDASERCGWKRQTYDHGRPSAGVDLGPGKTDILVEVKCPIESRALLTFVLQRSPQPKLPAKEWRSRRGNDYQDGALSLRLEFSLYRPLSYSVSLSLEWSSKMVPQVVD